MGLAGRFHPDHQLWFISGGFLEWLKKDCKVESRLSQESVPSLISNVCPERKGRGVRCRRSYGSREGAMSTSLGDRDNFLWKVMSEMTLKEEQQTGR